MYQVIQNQAWFHHSLKERGGGHVSSLRTVAQTIVTLMFVDDEVSLDFEMVPLQLLIVTIFLTIDLTYFLIEHVFWSSQFVIVK